MNYKSSILSAPAFNPTPESQTFFIDAFRSHNYLAGGLKLIISPTKFVDVRFEGYIFQPYQSIKENSDKKAEYSSPFLYRYYSGLAAAVINSPIGPISIGINYYDQYENPFSFFKYIVINPTLFSKEEFVHILTHERIHAKQWHSLDVLISKVFCAFFWINPISWLYRKAMLQNLEFIADNQSLEKLIVNTNIKKHF